MAQHVSSSIDRPVRLLLLPPPPSETSIPRLRVAYEPALSQVMTHAAAQAGSKPPLVYVAILLEQPSAFYKEARGRNYEACQGLFARIYRLIAILSVEKVKDQSADDTVDFRMFLVTTNNNGDEDGSATQMNLQFQGPLVNLQTLAKCTKPWKQVYSVQGEAGESFLRRFSKLHQQFQDSQPPSTRTSFEVLRVAGGTAMKLVANESSNSQDVEIKRHYSVAVGGTFDHLHIGHKLLLSATAFLVEPSTQGLDRERCLTVGITGDELLKNKKYAQALESWDERQVAVYDFLSTVIDFDDVSLVKVQELFNEAEGGKEVRYHLQSGLVIKCVEISNPFGPTITDESISALVVSGETRSGGKSVNDERSKLGWASLEIFEVDVLDASASDGSDAAGTENFQSKISSTEIRKRIQQKSAAAL